MVHSIQVTSRSLGVKTGSRLVALVLSFAALLAGCSGDTVSRPPALFGGTGQIQVQITSTLPGSAMNAALDEILIWASNGPWLLSERISYEGNLGGETLSASRLNPGELAREYASFIQQLNETQGLRLFGGEVSQDLTPECGGTLPSTKVVFTVRDDGRGEVAEWTRCAEGTLFTIEPGSAAPDAAAPRVITASQLARFFTIGEASSSSYSGTVPYAALAQGPDSPAREGAARAFISTAGEAPTDFLEFWDKHAGPGAALPRVEWATELVLLIAVGLRREAGVTVRVRRVLPLGQANGTRVEVIEGVPGDFCSPAAVNGYPFQLVVVPMEGIHIPIEFTSPRVERIPCGA